MRLILLIYIINCFSINLIIGQQTNKYKLKKSIHNVNLDARFKLPTPDKLAFVDSLFKEGKSEKEYQYYGYTKAILNNEFWISYPRGHSPSDSLIGIGSKEFKLNVGSEVGELVFAFYHRIHNGYFIGNTILNKMDCAFFKSGEDGCVILESYSLSTSNRPNFIKVVSFDNATGIFKARFRLTFKRDSNNSTYPEYLFFDDGVIYTKVFKQY